MKIETTYGHYKKWLYHKHNKYKQEHRSSLRDVVTDRLYGIGRLIIAKLTNKPFTVTIQCQDNQVQDALRIFHHGTPVAACRSDDYENSLEAYLSVGEHTHEILKQYVELESSQDKYTDRYISILNELCCSVSELNNAFKQLTSVLYTIQNNHSEDVKNEFKVMVQLEYRGIRQDFNKLVGYLNEKINLDITYAKQQLLSFLRLPHGKTVIPNKGLKVVHLPTDRFFSRYSALYKTLSGFFSDDLRMIFSSDNCSFFEELKKIHQSYHFIIA